MVWLWAAIGCGGEDPETTEPPRVLDGPLFGRGLAVDGQRLWVTAPSPDGSGAVLGFEGGSAVVTISALAPGDIGDSVAACGDLDGDGTNDLVIGAPTREEDGGMWWLLGGPDLATATFVAGFREAGAAGSFVVCGDVNGDGAVDAVMSAPLSPGEEIVNKPGTIEVYGWDDGALDKVANLETTWSNSQLGHRSALVAGEDFDGDGVDDLVVGAYGSDRVHYIPGPFRGSFDTNGAGITWLSEDGDGAGYSLAAGDLDGDGALDLLIGAPLFLGKQGSVLVAVHPATDDGGFLAPIARRLVGPGAGDQAGFSLAVVGDVDGDGADDWLAGTPASDGVGESAGAAYLVLGTGEGISDIDDAALAVVGEVPNSKLGWSVAGGDPDGDGEIELVIGAPEEDAGGVVGAGAVYVFDAGLRGRVGLGDAEARLSR